MTHENGLYALTYVLDSVCSTCIQKVLAEGLVYKIDKHLLPTCFKTLGGGPGIRQPSQAYLAWWLT